MTIFKVHSNFIYFSHIPKCAGSSIEDYFSTFPECSISFLDREFYSSSLNNWSKSSPQHILGNVVERLFDNNFFTDYLGIIREPIDRFKSTFNYQKYWLKNIEEKMDSNFFISEILPSNYQKQGWCDNHFQTQISFLIPNRKYKLFLMNQEGIRKAKKYIDQNIFANDREKEIPRNNMAKDLYSNKVEEIELNSKSIEVIKKLYSLDFDLFKELNKKYSSIEKSFFIFSKNNFEILNNENFELENNELKIKNEELRHKIEELKTINEKQRITNDVLNISIDELKNKVQELKTVNDELKTENDEKGIKNEALIINIDELKNKVQELKTENNEKGIKNETLNLIIDELKNKVQELKTVNDELKTENEEKGIKNETLNLIIDELKENLFSIQESRIWRYSYQYRRIMDKIRNLKN